MTENFFISDNNVKEKGLIHENVDTKLIKAAVRRAQDIELDQVLGSCLLAKLDSDIGTDAVSGVYEDLLKNYIQPYLIVCVEYRTTRYSLNKIRNKATGKDTDSNFQPLSREEMISFNDNLHNDSESYKSKLIGYLEDNKTDFPEYEDCECNEENKQPSSDVKRKIFY